MSARGETPEVAGAVDLGSQCALLLIGRADRAGSLEVLEDHALFTRLGEGLARGERLDRDAVQRTLDVLDTFARRMDLAGVPPDRRRLAGTEALRLAGDAAEFAGEVRRRTGLELRVLAPEEEARLGWRGAVAGGDGVTVDGVTVDFGGASTEIAWEGGERWLSLGLGALRPLSPEVLGGLLEEVPAGLGRGALVWLLGGSASNAACLEQDLESFDPRLAEGFELGRAALARWGERLAALDEEERLELALEPARAASLPWALSALAALLDRLGAESGRVTGRGLRHALLLEALGRA